MPKDRRLIGQVLKILIDDFPDVTISKIRFLETEGLISPERAPSGYRRYSDADVQRLRYILDVQKNQYLPLKVIKEHLDMIDQGLEPPAPVAETAEQGSSDHVGAEPAELTPASPLRGPSVDPRPRKPVRLARRDLLRVSGLTDTALVELERNGMITPRRGSPFYGRDALTVAIAARRLADYGMDVRHLRAIKQAVEREVGLIDQAAATHTRRGTSTSQTSADVMKLVLHAHAAMLRQSVAR